ncbi:cell wall hydrolase [Brevundimonas vancanneytii]|uniref:Spore cortex-lytic enzyme n=1 Tax=Brevundimonas vancanneytii TaxID=1325724 RepID=A0A4P1JW83_9CAUL|nr:cell wall hydrolase [Brevundimonas vancanneytii]VTO11593.1 Spore cortex-lytic enzyme precursor [Brevundimonas vancanneytii]
MQIADFRRRQTPLYGHRMNLGRLTPLKTTGRRAVAAAPAAMAVTLAAMGVAMSASSTPRPDIDRTAEAVARATGGDLGPDGLAAVTARMDAGQLAIARRHDPALGLPELYGLTPGWESLTLGGKPSLDQGVAGVAAQQLNAAMPNALGALQPARPFLFRPADEASRKRALRCLTQAVYYEAALEPTEGQEGVAQVVLNRVRDPNYPSSVCGVVYQGAERTTGCQFSFTCDGSLARGPVRWAWDRAERVAARALNGHVSERVGTATHYHADYVHPWWSPSLAKITQVGAHIFYRWKGAAGETAAFVTAYSGREPSIDEARFAQSRVLLATAADSVEAALEGAKSGELRTVEIDGQTRVVGVASLGGRRQAGKDEIAAINERLKAFESGAVPSVTVTAPPPAGVTPMAVEEVGKPQG